MTIGSVDAGPRISVVLCRPIFPRNIGMCARAMANLGVERLVLIAPRCELDEKARQGAVSAQHILRDATFFDSLAAFYATEGEGVRIALSGRTGRLREVGLFEEKLKTLAGFDDPLLLKPDVPIYLIFGPEDNGLDDEEIKLAHHVCALPTYGEFSSMNLSHAVMLALHITRSFLAQQRADSGPVGPSPSNPRALGPSNEGERMKQKLREMRTPAYFPEETIERWLKALGFDIDSRRVNAGRVLKRILLENEPTRDELRILEAVIQQTVRKLEGN